MRIKRGNVKSTINNHKRTRYKGKLLIFVFTTLVIIGAFVLYFFLSPKPWITQKTKTIEIGINVGIVDLIKVSDDVKVDEFTNPLVFNKLGKVDISFHAIKGDESQDIVFTYTVVDTTAPVIEKVNESNIAIGEEFVLSYYIKITDNSGEDLTSKVFFEDVSTSVIGDYSVELSVKDSSGNEAKYVFDYSVVDPTEIAPDLPGTKKVMQFINGLNRVTYVAEAGNPFGVTAGLYVGEFKREVTFESKVVGGLVLIPKVVEKLLNDRNGEAVFVPADISELSNLDSIDLTLEDVTGTDNIKYPKHWLKVDTHDNEVSISNHILNLYTTNQIWVREGTDLFDKGFRNGFLTRSDYADLYDFDIYGNFEREEDFQEVLPFGKKLTKTKNIFGIFLNSFIKMQAIQSSDLLLVGDSVVFLKDIE